MAVVADFRDGGGDIDDGLVGSAGAWDSDFGCGALGGDGLVDCGDCVGVLEAG